MGNTEKSSGREAKRVRRRQRIARAGRIGRRVALAVYWTGLLWILIVGFVTVIPQAFFPEISESTRTSTQSCPAALRDLRGELLETGAAVTGPARHRSVADTMAEWDTVFIGLRARCGEEAGYDDLERFRYRYETTLRRFAREEGALIERVDIALGTNES